MISLANSLRERKMILIQRKRRRYRRIEKKIEIKKNDGNRRVNEGGGGKARETRE